MSIKDYADKILNAIENNDNATARELAAELKAHTDRHIQGLHDYASESNDKTESLKKKVHALEKENDKLRTESDKGKDKDVDMSDSSPSNAQAPFRQTVSDIYKATTVSEKAELLVKTKKRLRDLSNLPGLFSF